MKNLTDLDTQQFWAEVEHEEIIKRIPVAVVVGLFSVVGIMGNFHILIVFSRNLNNFSTYHVMVSALAVSDLRDVSSRGNNNGDETLLLRL